MCAVLISLRSGFLHAEEGTFAKPKVSDISVYGNEREAIRRVVFSYRNGTEDVVGTKTSVHFTIDRPAKEVWPIFQDFNQWQSQIGYFMTGALGDREGDIEFLTGPKRENATIDQSQALKVAYIIPEQAIVLHSPPWEKVDKNGHRVGNRHEGKNVFMLTEVKGRTVVTAAMEHTFHYYGPNSRSNASKGLAQKVQAAQEKKKKGSKDLWEKSFIPKLKELVETKRTDSH
jgi:hypothetical protein